jgi:hypothetical protein
MLDIGITIAFIQSGELFMGTRIDHGDAIDRIVAKLARRNVRFIRPDNQPKFRIKLLDTLMFILIIWLSGVGAVTDWWVIPLAVVPSVIVGALLHRTWGKKPLTRVEVRDIDGKEVLAKSHKPVHGQETWDRYQQTLQDYYEFHDKHPDMSQDNTAIEIHVSRGTLQTVLQYHRLGHLQLPWRVRLRRTTHRLKNALKSVG